MRAAKNRARDKPGPLYCSEKLLTPSPLDLSGVMRDCLHVDKRMKEGRWMDPGCKAELKCKLNALTFNLGLSFTSAQTTDLYFLCLILNTCEEGRLCNLTSDARRCVAALLHQI